jgi:hypothetical protein
MPYVAPTSSDPRGGVWVQSKALVVSIAVERKRSEKWDS